MKGALESVSGLKMDDFFEKYINGTQTFDYKTLYGYVGLTVDIKENNDVSLGVSTSGNKITKVNRGSSAYQGGLNVNDEIIAIDGFRVHNDISDYISGRPIGDEVTILLSRDDLIQTITLPLLAKGSKRYFIFNEFDKKNSFHKKWLSQE